MSLAAKRSFASRKAYTTTALNVLDPARTWSWKSLNKPWRMRPAWRLVRCNIRRQPSVAGAFHTRYAMQGAPMLPSRLHSRGAASDFADGPRLALGHAIIAKGHLTRRASFSGIIPSRYKSETVASN